MEQSEGDYDAGFFDGRDFAQRAMPRVPNRRELGDIAQAFAEAYEQEFKIGEEVVSRAYVAVFERYRSRSSVVAKVALVVHEAKPEDFECYVWNVNGCTLLD